MHQGYQKNLSGFINVLKPPGMSSAAVVSYVRRTLDMKRVGHAGTLDPGAAGVLPIAVGWATRLVEYLHQCTKSYRAELTFGMVTDTYDAQGEVIERYPDCKVNMEDLEQVLASFQGEIYQTPPAYSALRVGGRRLYELAREGVKVTPKPRRVHISKLRVVKELLPDQERISSCFIDVECSSGTYIRSLCYDIGKLLGCGAYMSFLVRTRVGPFSLVESVCLEEIGNGQAAEATLNNPQVAISHMPKIMLTQEQKDRFVHGVPLELESVYAEGEYGVFCSGTGFLLGIGVLSRHYLQPKKVFHRD
ncbi:MAG: tRNA pseudouridine(55) synthase TruB [Limnochordia bacterium]|jgi:tRNA pseudouridine55 synthase|nr:tRNA pseudouridine(55) synthase TruB [Limnochordia bacterium]MDD2630676.1 tRNA pseudouridine(55) synthase TruB [Limnochordia bacterium]MDD4517948.1 tRNA pseudouridine(55) synthase TruB [Limnochordia bacterium]